MIGLWHMRIGSLNGMKTTAALAMLASLTGCTSIALFGNPEPSPAPSAAISGPTPPPPVHIAGNWQLAAASGGSCVMAFDANPGSAGAAPNGSIAPRGGCPGSFFTSRRWAYDGGALIIRDFKGRPLAHLSFVGGHFEGKDKNGGALTLTKQL